MTQDAIRNLLHAFAERYEVVFGDERWFQSYRFIYDFSVFQKRLADHFDCVAFNLNDSPGKSLSWNPNVDVFTPFIVLGSVDSVARFLSSLSDLRRLSMCWFDVRRFDRWIDPFAKTETGEFTLDVFREFLKDDPGLMFEIEVIKSSLVNRSQPVELAVSMPRGGF